MYVCPSASAIKFCIAMFRLGWASLVRPCVCGAGVRNVGKRRRKRLQCTFFLSYEKRKKESEQAGYAPKSDLTTQWTGFEPVRAEPNWFRVNRLNHSATTAQARRVLRKVTPFSWVRALTDSRQYSSSQVSSPRLACMEYACACAVNCCCYCLLETQQASNITGCPK